jgi:hypothetical protein
MFTYPKGLLNELCFYNLDYGSSESTAPNLSSYSTMELSPL